MSEVTALSQTYAQQVSSGPTGSSAVDRGSRPGSAGETDRDRPLGIIRTGPGEPALDAQTPQGVMPEMVPGLQGEQDLNAGEVANLVSQLNHALQSRVGENADVNLALSEEADGVLVIQVRHQETGDLIMQFPPAALLKMQERMVEVAGMLFDQKS